MMEEPEIRGEIRGQVVILSDKVAMKLMYRQLLKPDGYTVYTAGDLEGCRDCLSDCPASVVLIDTSRDPAAVLDEARDLAVSCPAACIMPLIPGGANADRFQANQPPGPGISPIYKPVDFGTIRKRISEAFEAMALGEEGLRGRQEGRDRFPEAARAAEILKSLSLKFSHVTDSEDLYMAGAEAERILMDILESVERLRIDGDSGRPAGRVSARHAAGDGAGPHETASCRAQMSGAVAPAVDRAGFSPPETPSEGASAPTEGFDTLTLNCPVCETVFAFYRPDLSSLETDGTDSDGMPRFRGENPMVYEAACCPNCLFAAFPSDFSALSEKERLLISSDRNLRVRKVGTGGIHFPRTATGGMRAMELAAECYKFRKPRGFLGNLYLRAAWIARQAEDDQREKHFLRKAVTFYEYAVKNERILGGERERLEIFSLLGDLFDRLGDTGKSERYFEAILKEGDPTVNPAALEKARLRRRVKLARAREG